MADTGTFFRGISQVNVTIDHRVRNSANPFVRDMPTYTRTSQVSVHGYPADKSILLQLETRLTDKKRELGHPMQT